MPGGSHPGNVGGERSSRQQNERERAMGGGTGNNQGGMSPGLMNSKYPGMKGKKVKSAELSLENVGTIIGKMADLTNPALAGLKMGVETLTGTDLPTFDDSFSNMGPDVPAGPAGFAENNAKETTAQLAAIKNQNKPTRKKKEPLAKGFSLLSGVGGTLLGT